MYNLYHMPAALELHHDHVTHMRPALPIPDPLLPNQTLIKLPAGAMPKAFKSSVHSLVPESFAMCR